MKQTIAKLGNQGNQSKPLAPRDLRCHFCGGNHFKNSCDILKEYIRDEKCMLRNDGRIALPGGRFIPGSIAGKWFKERLDEWYRQNPQPSSTTNSLLLGVLPEPAAATFQLSLEERIQSLEKELFTLRTRQQDKGTRTRAQKARDQEQVAEAPAASDASASAPITVSRQPEAITSEGNANHTSQPLVHPFAHAKDASYSPPTTDNVAAKPKPPLPKKPEGSYKTTAPIYDLKVASEVYAHTMDSQITLTQRELLSLSPEVQNQVREATTNRRVARMGAPAASADNNLLDMLAGMEVDDETDQARHEAARLAAMPATYQATVHAFAPYAPWRNHVLRPVPRHSQPRVRHTPW